MTRKQIASAISTVIDPELNVSIVDLGLLYDIFVTEEGVEITLSMTSQMCPMIPIIVSGVKSAISNIYKGQIDIEVVWEPAWTFDMLTQDLRIIWGV